MADECCPSRLLMSHVGLTVQKLQLKTVCALDLDALFLYGCGAAAKEKTKGARLHGEDDEDVKVVVGGR